MAQKQGNSSCRGSYRSQYRSLCRCLYRSLCRRLCQGLYRGNRAKELERCVELYQEFMMNRGKIDRAMAGIMVGVFSKTSRIDELMRLLQDMKVEGTRLDARLCTSALNALRYAGLNSQIRWLQESFDAA